MSLAGYLRTSIDGRSNDSGLVRTIEQGVYMFYLYQAMPFSKVKFMDTVASEERLTRLGQGRAG